MKSLFGGSQSSAPSPPPAPPPPPSTDDAASRAAAAQEAGRIRRGQGYSGTILTGGSGVTDKATTQKKTLLGQ